MNSINKTSARTVSPATSQSQPFLLWVPAVAVFLLGAVFRLVGLDHHKLWLDELYTAELVQGGLGEIWRNSFVDHTLPLPNALFWLGAQINGLSGWSLRIVSALASVATLALYYRYCARVLDRWTALLALAALSILPLAVYYAQEARPYALQLLAIVITWHWLEQVRRSPTARSWIMYTATACLAVQIHYTDILFVGGQLLALVFLHRNRAQALIRSAGVLAVVVVSLLPFLSGLSAQVSEWQTRGAPLQFVSSMQTMASGDLRIASPLIRMASFATIAIGAVAAVLDRRRWVVLLPHVTQIAVVLGTIFVLLPLLGRPAPAFQERQFVLLLPSVLVLWSVGVRALMAQRVGQVTAALLCGTLLYTASTTVTHYYRDLVKSPGAEIAALVAAEAQAGDVIVSATNAYWVDAALQFYHPEQKVYRYRGTEPEGMLFAPNPSILHSHWWGVDAPVPAATITQHDRIWLVWREPGPPDFVQPLTHGYQPGAMYRMSSFTAQLVERR